MSFHVHLCSQQRQQQRQQQVTASQQRRIKLTSCGVNSYSYVYGACPTILFCVPRAQLKPTLAAFV